MAYCDICGNYDDEHTDGEPSMMRGRNYKPLLDYHYSAEMLGKDWAKYEDWSDIFPEVEFLEDCQDYWEEHFDEVVQDIKEYANSDFKKPIEERDHYVN